MAQSALDGVDPIADGLAAPLFRRSVTTCPNGQKVGIAAYVGRKVATTKQDEKGYGIFQFGAVRLSRICLYASVECMPIGKTAIYRV